MDKLSHLEQYKMLREEIMLYIQQVFRMELSAAVAVGAVYAWLLINRADQVHPVHVPSYVWGVPPFLILISAGRCLHLTREMKRIGGYLSLIEKADFGDNTTVLGWERYKTTEKHHWFDRTTNFIAGGVWVVVFGGSIYLSWRLSQ